ncbi:MAG: hypothetical protein ACRYFU_22450 [Janthinobacterium lividum]
MAMNLEGKQIAASDPRARYYANTGDWTVVATAIVAAIGKAAASARDAISHPGLAWFRDGTPPEAKPGCWASANVGTLTFARY